MARIIHPKTFSGWKGVSAKISEKHSTDGANSQLIAYIEQNEIDPAAIAGKLENADSLDESHSSLSQETEMHMENRNNLFNPAFKSLKSAAQFLKGLHANNPRTLADWGFNIDNFNKIVFPKDFVNRKDVFLKFHKKYMDYDPNPTPIDVWITENEVDMAQLKEDVDDAATAHDYFEKRKGEKENIREQRDLIFVPEKDKVKGICNFLKKLYSKNPQHLGDYGIRVDSSPKRRKPKTYRVKQNTSKTIIRAKRGSYLENTGKVSLLVYAGKTTEGKSITVEAGGKFKIVMGYSTITVQNISKDVVGIFKAVKSN